MTNIGGNNLQKLILLSSQIKDKEDELRIIELVREDLCQNSLECLNYFLEKFCGVKSKKEEFYYYFWLTYSEQKYTQAQKPIKYFALIMWQKFKKDNIDKIKTEELPEIIIDDFEDKLLNEIYIRQLLEALDEEEQETVKNILSDNNYTVPPSLKNKLRRKLKK